MPKFSKLRDTLSPCFTFSKSIRATICSYITSDTLVNLDDMSFSSCSPMTDNTVWDGLVLKIWLKIEAYFYTLSSLCPVDALKIASKLANYDIVASSFRLFSKSTF